MTKPIIAYKGFNEDWTCRGFQYEVGKTYEHDGDVTACHSGFHACENPFDVWSYYGPFNSKYATVSLEGDTSRDGDDSKIAAAKITISAELSSGEFVRKCVEWVKAATKGKNESGRDAWIGSSGDDARIGSSGDDARIGSSGYDAQIASSGYDARIGSSGYDARIASSGYGARIGSSGDGARIEAKGENSVIACASSAEVKAGANGAICIPFHDSERMRFAVGYVGECGIKPDTWYHVKNGKLAEIKQ